MVGLTPAAASVPVVIEGLPNFFAPTRAVAKNNSREALCMLAVRGTRGSYVTTDDTVWAKIFEPVFLQCF